MTVDQIGIALGCLAGTMMAAVFIVFANDFERYADCEITEFFGFIGIIFVVALAITLIFY